MSRKRLLLLAILVIAAMVLAACPKPTPEKVVETVVVTKEVKQVVKETVVVTKEVEKTVVVTPTPTPEGAYVERPYRLAIFEDLTTTNPWSYYGPNSTVWNGYVIGLMLPSLYGYSDQRFDWIPSLAADFPTPLEQEGDYWVSTVKMKEGVKWSDGEPITAEDVAFTVNAALQLKLTDNWEAAYDPEYVDHAEAVDTYTVKFYFKKKPGLARWQFGAAMGPILPKHFWASAVEEAKKKLEGVDPNDEEAYKKALEEAHKVLYTAPADGQPTGGAFGLTKWEKGAFVQSDRNENWAFKGQHVVEYKNGAYYEEVPGWYEFCAYGDCSGDVTLDYTVGPYVTSVLHNLYGSQDAAILALQKDEVDFMLNPLGLQVGLAQQLEQAGNFRVVRNPSNGFRYLGFNFERHPQDVKEFREAVAYLIDKEFITQRLLQGAALPVYTLVPEGNGYWFNPDVPKIGQGLSREERVNKAVELLKSAGFTWDKEPKWDPDKKAVDPGEGLKLPDGSPMPEFEILAPSAGYDPMRATAAIWIEKWLNEVGIPAKANLTGFNVIVQKVFVEGDFDMWILGWGLSLYPDYLCDFFMSDSGYNVGHYNNPEFDKKCSAFLEETDMEKAREQAFELQEILSTELPYVTLFTAPILEAYNPEVVQFPYTETLDGIQNWNGMPSAVKLMK
ncbi:MAG: ABC transporter substrate-binding protein [Chloroflexi bacterium]|nr:ABC transporter substrate-binding protein [Chloroflexota bacterium]